MTWAPPPEDHPLARLRQLSLTVLLGPRSRYGAHYFRLFREGQEVLGGLYSQGPYPGYNWLEVLRYNAPEEAEAGRVEWEGEVFRALGALVPPGGHLMVEYESPRWQETARALAGGVPPAATELGLLLLEAGCGAAFKDWYFPEGGAEGPRKLQGFKALEQENARAGARRQRGALAAFLSWASQGPLRDRAQRALALLEGVFAE